LGERTAVADSGRREIGKKSWIGKPASQLEESPAMRIMLFALTVVNFALLSLDLCVMAYFLLLFSGMEIAIGINLPVGAALIAAFILWKRPWAVNKWIAFPLGVPMAFLVLYMIGIIQDALINN
jgi:hypothetical protein